MIDTGLPEIRHLQLANVDDDPDLEIVFVAGSSLHVYELRAGALVPRDSPVTMEGVDLVRAVQLDSSPYDELVVVEQNTLRVLTMQGNTYTTYRTLPLGDNLDAPVDVQLSSLGSLATLIVGHVAKATVVSYDQELDLDLGGSQSVSKLTGLAVGQLGGDDLASELVLLTSSQVEIWDANLGSQVGGPLEIAGVSRAVVGDVLGDATAELVYVIGANVDTIGTLAAVRLEGDTIMRPYEETIDDLVGVLELADIDGDGRQDLVSLLSGTATNAALVLLGGDTFSEPHTLPVSITPRALARPADLTGDGVPDLVITDGSRLVLLPSNP